MTRPLRAVLYARCSSAKQAERDLSVPAQLDACRRHAAGNGWLVVGEYHDDGISGFEGERRPAFTQMLDAVRSSPRPFDIIVIWDLSRFSRDLTFSLYTTAEIQRAGVLLHSIKEQTDDTPAGWLMSTVIRSFNEFQVRKLAVDTHRGMVSNAEKGGWNGGPAPLGYKVEQEARGPKVLVPDPESAPIVQRIFALALAGFGSVAITKSLNEDGYRTARGNRFSKASVLNILKNEVYTGVYIWGARSSAKFAPHTGDPLRREGAHEALVSREDFERAQAMIALRRPGRAHPKASSSTYILSGLLTCGHCGAPYIGHSAKGGQYHYYTCQTKQKQGAAACPEARNFVQHTAEHVVVEALQRGALSPEVFADLVREVQVALREDQGKLLGQRAVVQAELIACDRKLDNLFAAVETGTIPAARLAPRIEAVSQEREALETRLQSLPESSDEPILEIGASEIDAWVRDLRAVLQRGSPDERRGLLRAWIKSIVADGDDLTIEYTFPIVGVSTPSGGASGGGEPVSGTAVNTCTSAQSPFPPAQTTKGEPSHRRVLPIVRSGSPRWTRTNDTRINSPVL